MKSRRRFSKEFRAKAIALAKQQGLSVNKVTEDLGLPGVRTVARTIKSRKTTAISLKCLQPRSNNS